MSEDTLTCRDFSKFLSDYLEGELPDRQRFVFELHLKLCRECRDYLAAYRRTIEVSQQALEDPDGPLPEAVPEDLIKAVLAARDA